MQENEISLLHLFTRHWRLSILIVCACIGLAGLVTAIMPRTYESQMKFLVNNERADLVITPEKNQAAAPPSEVTETQVNSEIELLKSHDNLETIVRNHRLYQKPGAPKVTAQPSRLAVARATLTLSRGLNISAIRKTNIIDVSYRASDPDLAVDVLNDLGSRYLSAHLAAHSAPGTYQFFTDEAEKYSRQLVQARAALSEFHRRERLFSLPQQQSAAVEQLVATEAQLKNVTAELAEQQTRLAENQRQLSGSPERIATQVKQIPNQYAAEHLEGMLADLRSRRIDLAMKFKPTDRLITELDQQIAAAEQQLAAIQAGSATEQTTDLDTLHQAFRGDAAKGEVALRALDTRRAQLTVMRQSYLDQLDKMDRNTGNLQSLEQYEKEALDNYTLYTHRLDEARLAESLDAQKFSNVTMIEKPVSSPLPASPKLSLNLAVGMLMGIFLSLAISFFLETKGNRSVIQTSAGETTEDLYRPRVFHAHATGD